jgi:hypothetical protein
MKIIRESIKSLQDKEEVCWAMANVFLQNKNAHGLNNITVEIQALQRAQQELLKLGD